MVKSSGADLLQIFLAGLQMRDRADIAARQFGLLRLERHRLADLAGANQFGFALDDAEQRAHDVHQVLGELARLGRRRRQSGSARAAGCR